VEVTTNDLFCTSAGRVLCFVIVLYCVQYTYSVYSDWRRFRFFSTPRDAGSYGFTSRRANAQRMCNGDYVSIRSCLHEYENISLKSVRLHLWHRFSVINVQNRQYGLSKCRTFLSQLL